MAIQCPFVRTCQVLRLVNMANDKICTSCSRVTMSNFGEVCELTQIQTYINAYIVSSINDQTADTYARNVSMITLIRENADTLSSPGSSPGSSHYYVIANM
jgi:hypothetical protein